jgi:hypothetical protein
MAIHILSKRPAIPLAIYEAVETISSEFPEDWNLSLINSSNNEEIEIKLQQAPNGVRHQDRIGLTGSDETDSESIQQVLRQLRYKSIGQVA